MVKDGKSRTDLGSVKKVKHLGVSSTAWKVIIILIMLGLLGALVYFTYTSLTDGENKVPQTPILAGLIIAYVSILSVFGFVMYMIVTGEFDTVIKESEEIRKHKTGVYVLIWFTIISFLFVFGTVLYSVLAEEPPLGISYTRPAPPGTQLGESLKKPSEYS